MISECPREYVGGEMIHAINLASMCGGGDWPVAGGLLDQSSWFVSLKQHCRNERSKLEAEESNGV